MPLGLQGWAGDTARHGRNKGEGTINVLYYDGHVNAVPPSEGFYVVCDPMRTTKKQ